MAKYKTDQRVQCFDYLLFKNDKETPDCWMDATILCEYSGEKIYDGKKVSYPELYDVMFDHRGVSIGHLPHSIRPQ